MSTNRGLICAVAIGMLMTGAVWAGTCETNAAAFPPHEGKGFGGQFLAGLEKLNLTADQSQQIESIVKLDQESVKAAATQSKETREALNHQVQAGPFDEQSVRAACKKAAATSEEDAVLRAKVNGQIRAVLTNDQQVNLDKMRAEFWGNMQKRFGKGHGTANK